MKVTQITPPIERRFIIDCDEGELRLLDKVLGDTPLSDRSTQNIYSAIADAVRAIPR